MIILNINMIIPNINMITPKWTYNYVQMESNTSETQNEKMNIRCYIFVMLRTLCPRQVSTNQTSKFSFGTKSWDSTTQQSFVGSPPCSSDVSCSGALLFSFSCHLIWYHAFMHIRAFARAQIYIFVNEYGCELWFVRFWWSMSGYN